MTASVSWCVSASPVIVSPSPSSGTDMKCGKAKRNYTGMTRSPTRYDSQPYPNDPVLQSTQPHHKHVPPDIKHHRLPAPELSFIRPNLPVLMREVESSIVRRAHASEPQQEA